MVYLDKPNCVCYVFAYIYLSMGRILESNTYLK